MISDKLTEFAGKRVVDWEPGKALRDPGQTAYRISALWDEYQSTFDAPRHGGSVNGASATDPTWRGQFEAFLMDPRAPEVTAIVVGPWDGVMDGGELIVDTLVEAADRLPGLTALFLGDITVEESEISWIQQGDFLPLLSAYPRLDQLGVRGHVEIRGSLEHDRLQSLVVESGGLDVSVVRGICNGRLPALEHLELWLGTDEYGATTTIADLQPILGGGLFPRLNYLGLRDSEIADEVAVAIASSPVLERIKTLDLSLGTLTDLGAEALVQSAAVRRLEKLDLHYHFLSEEMERQLASLGIEVDVSDRQQPDEDSDGGLYRYVAVGE